MLSHVTYFSVCVINVWATSRDMSLPKVVSVKEDIKRQERKKERKSPSTIICNDDNNNSNNINEKKTNNQRQSVCFLTHNSIHNDHSNVMLYVKFSLIALVVQALHALCNTFREDWHVALQYGQTKGGIKKLPLMLPSVS